MYTLHIYTFTFILLPFLSQNNGLWISGPGRAGGGEDAEEALQPLPVDSWEISPDSIIMDTMLGEGQFGEVYKGLIKDEYVNNPYFKGSECVAVKILRREWLCAVCLLCGHLYEHECMHACV